MKNIIEILRENWWNIVLQNNIADETIKVSVRPLTSKEAIGTPIKKDYPLLKGKEVLIQAIFKDSIGQAFVDEPTDFQGTLYEINSLPLNTNKNRGLFVATVNATYRYLHLTEGTIHCKNEEPELCAEEIKQYLMKNFKDKKIALLGFQPAFVSLLGKYFDLRVVDMDMENTNKIKYGIFIHPIEEEEKIIEESDLVLATGSSLVNGTIDKIIALSKNKPLYFYGTTISACASICKLNRLCFKSK